jgi:CheY-like chemotaxis protein
VVISVSDTGPGIPEDERSRIFDEFYQIDRSLSRKQDGVGLGLAICQRFVKVHEGRIWVDSQVGVGSTFSFALPIPGEYLPAAPMVKGGTREQAVSEMRRPILVVDPDPAVGELVRRHVQAYEVVQMTGLDQLAEAVVLYHPQAVIHNVPPGNQGTSEGTSGIPVPVIECSLPSQSWLAEEWQIAACLSKPITSARLLEELEQLGDVRDVLVVDDDRGFCQLMERTLKAGGSVADVRHAYDGRDGLEAMRASRPDLVLLDLAMPDLDGFDVLKEMRKEPALAEVPVILITAVSLADHFLMQRSRRIVIHRPDGLHLVETLRCLETVIGVLEPRYDERAAPEGIVKGRAA